MKTNMNATVSIRTMVLSLFLVTSCLIAGLSLGMHFYFNRQLAESTAEKTFTATAERIGAHIQGLEHDSYKFLAILGLFKISLPAHEKDNRSSQRVLFIRLMEQNAQLHAIHLSNSDGNFFGVINLKDTTAYPDANPADRWVTVYIEKQGDHRVETIRFFDKDLVMRATIKKPTGYDPKTRPWYQQASSASGMVISSPYLFEHQRITGVTYAQRFVPTEMVIGIDVSLAGMHTFLTGEHFPPRSNAFTFQRDIHNGVVNGSVPWEKKEPLHLLPKEWVAQHNPTSAAPSIDFVKLQHQELRKLANEKNRIGTIQVVRIGGEPYFAYVHRLKQISGEHDFIGVLSPVADTIAPYMRKAYISLLATLGLLLLLTPLVWKMVERIINPVNALAREGEKITRKNYGDVAEVRSNITEIVHLSRSLMSVATSIKGYEKAQRDLLDSFIKLIANAIDKKSPYTGGHCKRVPELSVMIAQAATKVCTGPLAEFGFKGNDQWREFHVAAWLHDCGKVTTPEHIVDKGTKLEVISNRIHEIRTRFEVLLRDAEIEYWKKLAHGASDPDTCLKILQTTQKQLKDDFAFVAQCNIGSEFMAPEKVERIKTIARKTWIRNLDDRLGLSHIELQRYPPLAPQLPCQETLLADRPEHIVERTAADKTHIHESRFALEIPEHMYNQGEIYNLCIPHGTLTPEDRYKINEHVISTIRMLEILPFPKNLARVSEYAGVHHETLIGTGYPCKLKGEEICLPGRILALADIFEALTASDRPYKKAKKLSEAVRILGCMAKDGHIDPDLFRLFISSGLYLKYAKKYLSPAQIDEIDVGAYI